MMGNGIAFDNDHNDQRRVSRFVNSKPLEYSIAIIVTTVLSFKLNQHCYCQHRAFK